MLSPARSPQSVRFGDFELHLDAGELRRGGNRVSLPEQPLRLLEVLLEHPGVVVSREQLRERLWGADTFVDFEHGLNAAVKRLRDALGDSADTPRFIETVPKRGYRFIATVEGDGATKPADGRSAGTRPVGQWGLLAVLAVALLGVTWWWARRPADPENSPVPSRLTRLTFDKGLQTDPAFSPDGRFVAYTSNTSGNFDIWIAPLDGGAATRLTDDPAHDTQPDWSPDGRSILFRSERDGGGLFAISPADRHVTRLTTSGFGPQWSPDGRRFAFSSGVFSSGTSFVASADGTNITPMAHQNEPGALNRAMGWHPRGQLVWLRGGGADNISMVSSRVPAGSAHASLVADDVRRRFDELKLGVMDNQRLVWSADGRALYFVGLAHGVVDIWRMSVDPADLSVTGGPVRVTAGSGAELAVARAPRGGLAFSETVRIMRAWAMDLDVNGRIVPGTAKAVTGESVSASDHALSPDGRRLVVRLDHPGGDRRAELREILLDAGAERILRTIDTEHEDVRSPRWSRDGRRLAYSYRQFSKKAFASAIKMLDVGSLQESFVTSMWSDGTPALENPWGWSADGRSVLVSSTRYSHPGQFGVARVPLSAAPRGENAARVLVAVDKQGAWQANESPNGRWVCYNATPLPSFDSSTLYIVSAAGGNPRRLVDGTWDDMPRWSADGRLLYFLSRREGSLNVWAVKVDARRGLATGSPFQVTYYNKDPAETIADNIGSTEFSVGGTRLALVVQRLVGGIWVLR
jgi:Tol biopolymer transport system component/DNA-binding winged helix-turn-helix (wHTH) protein